MLKDKKEFKDFGHVIEYRPLYYYKCMRNIKRSGLTNINERIDSNFYLPMIDGKPLTPVSSRYSPIKTEDIVKKATDLLYDNAIGIKEVKSELTGGKVMNVKIILDKNFGVDHLMENDLLDSVLNELDYDYANVRRKDIIDMMFVVVNSYDGWLPLMGYFGFYRQVCTNGMVVAETVKESRMIHIGNVDQKFRQFFAELFHKNIEKFSAFLEKKDTEVSTDTIQTIIEYMLQFGFFKRNVEKLLKPYVEQEKKIRLWTLYNLLTYMVSRSKTLEVDVRKQVAIQRKIFDRLDQQVRFVL